MTDGLNPDTAEYDDGLPRGATCAFCRKPTSNFYYQVGGQVACKDCQPKIAVELARAPDFWRAAGLGLLAAVAGSALWYAIIRLTGYEIGLIAIVVGLLVGGAVRIGSGRVGGLSVQLLAIFLTYTSIVSSYVPLMIGEFSRVAEQETAAGGMRVGSEAVAPAGGESEARVFLEALGTALTSWTTDSVVDTDQERTLEASWTALRSLLAVNASPSFSFGDSGVSYAGAPLAEMNAWSWSPRLAGAGYPALTFESGASRLDLMRLMDDVRRQAPVDDAPAGFLQVTFAVAYLLALLYLAPLSAGIQNAIGILIIGFALWEAWRINRRPRVEITGPFEVEPAAVPAS